MPVLARLARCAVMAKRCASSRTRCTRYSPCDWRGSRIESGSTGQEDLFLLFRQAAHRHLPEQLESFQHLDRHAQLSFAAVDDQQIGQHRKRWIDPRRVAGLMLGGFRVEVAAEAARQRLAHRFEIVGAFHGLDAWLKSHDKPAVMEAAIAKLYLSECFVQSGLDAIRIHGGYGYTTEFEVERDFRDAIGGLLYSGTSDIQRVVIARWLGL